jgi:sigma-B regulation protein RsbU (phosphoserine phosphatase)
MPCLVIQSDRADRRVIPLDGEPLVLGRSPQADIIIDDNRASRRHARIHHHEGIYLIEDLNSRNGTLVNGVRIDVPRQLHPGDEIVIGGLNAVFDPHQATAVAMVPGGDSQRLRESSSSNVPLGDEGTLLRFSPGQSSRLGRRDPLVRLQIIYHFADRMRRCFGMDELLVCILDALFEVLAPDRAVVLLRDPRTGNMTSAASRQRDSHGEKRIPVSTSIISQAIASRSPVIARDAISDQRFEASQSIVASRIGTAVCMPMIAGDELCGLLYLDFLVRLHPLEDADLDLLAGLANQSAMAIGNALHHAEEVERRELEMQLGVARRVHDRLLSHTECDSDGVRVRSLNRPSKQVGGDYLGVLIRPEGVVLAVADGTGHGIGAALLMSTARAYLLALLADGTCQLPEVVSRLNRLVCEDVDPGLFVSLGLISIDRQHRCLSGVCAGHEPPLLYRAAENRFIELPTGGTVLGLDPFGSYDALTPVPLLPGDRILLFTDGIVEQLNNREEEFGFARLRQAIVEAGEGPAEELLATVLGRVDAWRGEVEQGDDYSLMAVEIR